MKKVLLTATVQSHICQFHRPLAEMLKENGYEIHVAARDNLAEKNGLTLDFADKVFDVPFSRSPINKSNISAYKALKKIISDGNYDIIHCNTPVGGVLTRLAAKNAEVIYTAHGFHFYEGAPKKNWLVYYPIEKAMSKKTDKLITISEADFKTASEKKFSCPIYRIHGIGFSKKRFSPPTDTEVSELRQKYGHGENAFIALCTGELNENKNQKTAVSAFASVVKELPTAILLLAGNGKTKEALEEQIKALGLENNVFLLGYRPNIEDFVKLCDVELSCSHREGLGMNLIEALACRKPVLGANNRGHREFISDGKNGFLFPADDSDALSKKILELAENKSLYESIAENCVDSVSEYSADNVKKELYEIYFK